MKKAVFSVFIFICHQGVAQQGYGAGDTVQNFTAVSVLNYSKPAASFHDLKKKLTIIDFFGTWCVPCIKALPRLSQLQKKYPNEVSIILVSVEEAGKLKSFIEKKAVSLPIVVDSDNKITNLFQPPAYPYTVLINDSDQVIAITEVAKLDDARIDAWLQNKTESRMTNQEKQTFSKPHAAYGLKKSANALVQLSQNFIYAAKTDDALLQQWITELDKIKEENLYSLLKGDAEKKAFWINIYNGFTQVFLKKNPEAYKSRNRFFKKNRIAVAGEKFSLDAIEHGILRRSKAKWSLGYFNKLFPSKGEKKLRVDTLDYRLHFALNCGAASCPPIAFYSAENIDAQLSLATKAYLKSEVEHEEKKNIVAVPAILGWFRADFGGKKGIRTLLKKEAIIPEGGHPKIVFRKYDWALLLNNYKNENE